MFYEELEKLWRSKGYKNLRQFSIAVGIPYMTIKSWENIPLEKISFGNICTLSDFFGVSWDYWNDIDKKQEALSKDEEVLIMLYRNEQAFKAGVDSLILALGLKKTGKDALSTRA